MSMHVRAQVRGTSAKESGTIARNVVRVRTPVQLVKWARDEPEEAAVWLGSALGRVSGAFAGALVGAVVAGVKAAADEARMVDVVIWDVDETGKKKGKQAGHIPKETDAREGERPGNLPHRKDDRP